MKPQMHLAIDVSWTQVETIWREPGARVNRHYPDVGLFEDIARVAERGLLDLIFFGDSTGIPNTWKNSIDDSMSRVCSTRSTTSPMAASPSMSSPRSAKPTRRTTASTN